MDNEALFCELKKRGRKAKLTEQPAGLTNGRDLEYPLNLDVSSRS